MSKKISLVLGSGGARGLAHIGVIQWLNENGFQIKSIAGCSMGALVGGIYAAGKLGDYEEWVRSIKKVDIFTLLDLSWGKSGLVKGDKLIQTLIELVGDQLIEDLPVLFTAVATDLNHQKEVWINSGSLFDAIRASVSIPLFFTPFKVKGSALVDGGVLNPVPIAPTFGDETDLTIAVNLCGPETEPEKKQLVKKKPAPKPSAFKEKMNQFTKYLEKSVKKKNRDWGAYEIAVQAFDAMQSTIARQKLAAYPPDIEIEIARNACRTLEFDRASEMIELGYRKTAQTLSPRLQDELPGSPATQGLLEKPTP